MHHHLVREESRTRCGLVIETGEAREVHHFALLTGYGAGAVNPYLAFATLQQTCWPRASLPTTYTYEKLEKNYVKAVGKGLLKVMCKDGHLHAAKLSRRSDLRSDRPERPDFVDEYFTWTPSRDARASGIETIAEESLRRHEHAYPRADVPQTLDLDVGGQYQWRRKGEAHIFSPDVIAKLQQPRPHQQPRRFPQVLRS